MAQLQSSTTITNSPPADNDLARTIAALRSSMRDGEGLTEPLTLATRGRLSVRLDLLRACVRQATSDQIQYEIAKLMMSYPSLRGASATDAAALVHQYAEALAGVPLWAVRDTCTAIARGAVSDLHPDFAPSSARLRQLVDNLVSAVHIEARAIKGLLVAPVTLPDNSEMARRSADVIKAGFKKLSQELHENVEAQFRPVLTEGSVSKAPSLTDLKEIYKTRNLPGVIRNVSRNDDRNVSSDVDTDGDHALADYDKRVAR